MRGVVHGNRSVREPVEQALHARRDAGRDDIAPWHGLAREPEEQLPLGVRQPQGPGESLYDLRRRGGGPSLLQPGQVVHRDTGQPGELLAAQPGSAPAATGRHARRLRGGAVAPAAYGLAELPRFHASSLRDSAGVLVALAVLRQRDRFLQACARRSLGA